MNQKHWNELKEHCKKQEQNLDKLNTPISKICKHIWKDVLNKMWSIEQEYKKEMLK
jgi:hypothetical protein